MLKFLQSKICCKHYSMDHRFLDLYRGGDGELYFRSEHICNICKERRITATRIPDDMTKLIDIGRKISEWVKK